MTDRERAEALLDKLLIGPESGTQEDWRDAIDAVLQHDRATRAAVWREAVQYIDEHEHLKTPDELDPRCKCQCFGILGAISTYCEQRAKEYET